MEIPVTTIPTGFPYPCDGSSACPASRHIHGCFRDFGSCDDPEDHNRRRESIVRRNSILADFVNISLLRPVWRQGNLTSGQPSVSLSGWSFHEIRTGWTRMADMKLIGRRGETEAWAEEPFDPATDDVVLRSPGNPDQKVMWQRALKFGYWESAGDD